MAGPIATSQMHSPIGPICITSDDDHLLGLKIGRTGGEANGHALLDEAQAQLIAWFEGRLQTFDLPVLPLKSAEAEAMRSGIAAIPYGETRTYGEIGKQTGAIARAIGQACKTNAIPIIIPCHRVVSTNGPAFYSAGEGPRTKGWLLDFEAAHLTPDKRTRLI